MKQHFKLIPLEERIVLDAAIAHVIFVNAAAHSGGDGLSWAHAYNDLQTAINKAETLSGSTQIWVAKGTYVPDGNSSSSTFLINDPNPLAIYGGFNAGASSLSQSNPGANATILSGVLSGGGNVNTIVTIDEGTITLGGLTISGANNPSGPGGGILQNSGTLTVSNDTFTNDLVGNISGDFGGGIASFNSNLTVINSSFTGNAARDGAAISAFGDITVNIKSSSIQNNNVYMGPDGNGSLGAVFAANCQNLNISSNTINNNISDSPDTATGGGVGGVLVESSINVTINSNTIDNNVGGNGGMSTLGNTNLSVTNNTISGNTGLGYGSTGGYFTSDNNPVISGNLFSNNTALDSINHVSAGGGLAIGFETIGATVTNNVFNHNVADNGGAIISGANPTLTITNNLFINNIANFAGGAISSGNTNPIITDFYGPDGNVTISQNVFINNKAGTFGGAVATQQDASVMLNQNVFAFNHAASGGAINDVSSATLTITNNVFAADSATQGNSVWLDGYETSVNGANPVTNASQVVANLVNDNLALFSDDIFI